MAVLSMNETTTFRWSFEEDAINYHAAGITAIGVWRRKLADCGEAKGVELLDELGMEVSHLFWAGGFTGSDGRSYRESLEDAAEAVQVASRIKAQTLVVCSGGRSGHTLNHARRLIRSALADLAPEAAELGVTLALEPMHPGCAAEWTFLTGIDDTLALIGELASPSVKMVFDAYHLGQDPANLSRIEQIMPHIALVQLGDARQPPDGEQNRCRLGEGAIPLAEMVSALKAAGYDGYYDVELLGEELESADYHAILEHAKDAARRLGIEVGKR
jgi:sugar phosphate isomerase/epimerase